MKKSHLLLLTAFASVLFATSCKKKDEPAPVVTAPVSANSGTFSINGSSQSPSIFFKDKFTQGITFTSVNVQNDKYSLSLTFNKYPLVDGQYTIEASLDAGMTVILSLEDLKTEKSVTIFEGQTSKVTVLGNRITFGGITSSLDGSAITLAGDLTVK